MPRFALNVHNNLKYGTGFIADMTEYFAADWRRSIRAVGGCWYGETKHAGEPWQMREFFLMNLFRRVTETVGGHVTWEGFIGEMELVHKNLRFVRSGMGVANYVKAMYTKIGDNLFADGSAESETWTQVGTPSTHEFTTSWFTRGTKSCHVVTDGTNEGTEIEASVGITAGRSYQCLVTVQIESGAWTLYIYQAGTSTVIAERAAGSTSGKEVLRAYISEENGQTSVDVQLKAAASGAEIYADAAILQLSPFRTETKWCTDATSESEFGRIEHILLEAGLTDAAADGLAQEYLERHRYPRTRPPERFEVYREPTDQPESLTVCCYGYAHTLNWRHALSGGTGTASANVTTLVGESEFVSAGVIDTNATSTQIEETYPIGLWDALEEIVHVGSGDGTPWTGGVYPGRYFNYEARPSIVQYRYLNGRLLSLEGTEIEPWYAEPGYCLMAEMPVEPTAPSAEDPDNPRVVWLSEVEFIAPDRLMIAREPDE